MSEVALIGVNRERGSCVTLGASDIDSERSHIFPELGIRYT
jgi:hypothetical protein